MRRRAAPTPTRRKPPMTSPHRISFVLHKFSRGGSDRVAAYLARGFADRGMDVELLVVTRGGEVEAALTELVGADIPIRYFGRFGGPRALDLVRGLPGLVRHLRARVPDTIVSTANNTAWISAAALRLSGLPNTRLFLKTTNPIARSRHVGLTKLVRRWGYRKAFAIADGVWPLSGEESAELREEYPDFASLFREVANPYVTPAMLAPPAAAPLAGRRRTVISVGRLTAQKRQDLLIAAFALVGTRDAHLTILGEGEDRATLEAQVAELGLRGRITMPGYVDDVAGALGRADLFVLTSDYEGLPAVVLEAMAANCPVLSTDCFPAARSMVGAPQGCAIIESTDPHDLAKLIDAHLSGPRPPHLRAVAERYSIANGVASHWEAMAYAECPTGVSAIRSDAQRVRSKAPGGRGA